MLLKKLHPFRYWEVRAKALKGLYLKHRFWYRRHRQWDRRKNPRHGPRALLRKRPISPALPIQHVMRIRLLKTFVYVAIILGAHMSVLHFYENFNVWDSIWLTLTTVTTVGYGDLAPQTAIGRLSTVLLVYIGGIFVFAKMAANYLDYRVQVRILKMKGEWDWNLKNHILIINAPAKNAENYFINLIDHIKETKYAKHPILMLNTQFQDGLPDSLQQFENLMYYHGRPDDMDTLLVSNAIFADVILILAKDPSDIVSDGSTFDLIHRFMELEANGMVVAECVDDHNRDRFIENGADIVLRPIRAYPEMTIRAILSPGVEQIIENIISAGTDEYIRFNIDITDKTWGDIVTKILMADLGTAIAYMPKRIKYFRSNPSSNTKINAQALVIMVHKGVSVSMDDVKLALGYCDSEQEAS